MLDKTIDSALANLRAQIIRGKLDGLDHVEALMLARGMALGEVRPKRKQDAARRGMMRVIVLDLLREGPANMRAIADHVAASRPDLAPSVAYRRTSQVLTKLRIAGLVVLEGRLWVKNNNPLHGA
jgi:hypothetical protein